MGQIQSGQQRAVELAGLGVVGFIIIVGDALGDIADDAKAGKLNGYLPDVDDTLKSGKGICFDYAALMAAMLRAQNIPVKLVTGNVSPNNLSHAWNLVYTREKGWIAFKIYFSGGSWKLMDATFGAAEGQNIEDYIGNGSKYTQLRVY